MKKTTLQRLIRTFLLIFCSFSLASCELSVATSTPQKGVERQVSVQTCRLNLQLFVRQGTNLNYSVLGKVDFSSQRSGGSLSGHLLEESGVNHPIYFSSTGPDIHFILELEKGRVFGVGMMDNSARDCLGSGGGTLSGPVLGDLGDWRGEWVPTTISKTITEIPRTPYQEPAPSWSLPNPPSFVLILLGIFVLFIAFKFFQVIAPFKYMNARKGLNPTLRRVEHNPGTESRVGREPVAEYQVVYTAADHVFDLSFEIEKASQYLGDFGVLVAKTLDEKLGQTVALEMWLFDMQGSQTTTKILVSDFCYHDEALRSELEKKGDAVLLQPEEIITLETSALTAKAKILQVEYENSPQPQRVFKTVVMKIRVWTNVP